MYGGKQSTSIPEEFSAQTQFSSNIGGGGFTTQREREREREHIQQMLSHVITLRAICRDSF